MKDLLLFKNRPAVGRLAQNGQFCGVVELSAGGADALVAVAARRFWFCYQLFAVLLRFELRRTGLAQVAALPHALGVLLDARLWVLRHAASRRCAGLAPGRAW